MRNQIQLQINGQDFKVGGRDAFLTLSDFLRLRLRLTGTKIVCSEGDCGSCSVLCGKPSPTGIDFRPVDSCILFMFQLDGTRIVTIEGLKLNGGLNSIQKAMIDCHGSQCGFCTPGFVVAMTGLMLKAQNLSPQEWRRGLTGNLCRCTGYTPIIHAGLKSSAIAVPNRNGEANRVAPRRHDCTAIDITAQFDGASHRVYSPVSVAQAVDFLALQPQAKIVAGATDLGVQFNKGQLQSRIWLDLNRIEQMRRVEINGGHLKVGATATWSEIETTVATRLPEFHSIIQVFGSPQIRHAGTLGGNIVNASPIADSLPFLFVCEAELTITSAAGERTVNINQFYRGYKNIDLKEGEILTEIRVPLPRPNRLLRLYKVSRRRDLDISSFTAAIWIELDDDTISDAGIAYGAVGPVVIRLGNTESFLRGKRFSIETMTQAGETAVNEISPISDVRGAADYRRQLARNVLKKFYWELETNRGQHPTQAHAG